jgi:TnpA family transposase
MFGVMRRRRSNSNKPSYGRRGRINARELHEQMNSCSCLTLLLACVVYWQAKEISRVLKEHVSPTEWENVYGQYVLNPDDIS